MQNSSSISIDPFLKAREAMVVSQLQPSGVITERVLNAYRAVPRENFLPRDKSGSCYMDETILLSDGNFMVEPMVHGIMMEHAAIQNGDKVLIVGDQTGYSSAIARELGGVVTDCLTAKGAPDSAPYDVIFVAGSICTITEDLKTQLKTGGVMVAILCADITQMGKIIVASKQQNNDVSIRSLKDAKLPYIQGSTPEQKFIF